MNIINYNLYNIIIRPYTFRSKTKNILSGQILWVIFLLCTFQFYGIVANAQSFQFAKKLGCDNADDRGADFAVDRQGNIYSTGYFRSWNGIGALAADFDPGPAFYPMWSNQGGYNTFISKLNSQGNFVWAKQFKGDYNIAEAIKLDALGNIYISGSFSGTVDFNPGQGIFNLTSVIGPGSFNQDAFVVKLSSSGNFLWAKSIGGSQTDANTDLSVLNNGDVLVAGTFMAEVDFDPGPNTTLLTSLDGGDAFLMKYDSNGNFRWAKNMGGKGDYGSITIDSSGSPLYCFTFDGISDLNPDPNIELIRTSIGFYDIAITKLDSAGNFLWNKTISSLSYDFGSDIITDSQGYIYMTGSFQGDSLWDGQTGSLIATNSSSSNKYEAFVIKMDKGGSIGWAHSLGDTADDEGTTIALARDGGVYCAGTFRGVVDFDPSFQSNIVQAIGDPDGFILKLDSTGKFIRVLTISGNRFVQPASMAEDSLLNLYAVGWYVSGFIDGTVDFDPGPGTFRMNGPSGGKGESIFILKLRSCLTDTTTETVAACQSYAWQNNTYTQTGTYAKTLSTPNGCDSTIVLKLTINQPVLADASYNLCPGETVVVGSKTYSQPGIYLDTLIAANGCDSLITSTIAYSYPNYTIVANGPQLEAATGQDSYQWLDCNAGFVPIQGETSSDFTPAVSGSYAVQVTKGNCSDTSDCVVFTSVSKSLSNTSELEVFPNPNSGEATIYYLNGKPGLPIEIYRADGALIKLVQLNAESNALVSKLSSGIYWIKVPDHRQKPVKMVVN